MKTATHRTRSRRHVHRLATACLALLVGATSWACGENSVTSLTPTGAFVGSLSLDGAPFAGALVSFSAGGEVMTATTDDMGNFSAAVSASREYALAVEGVPAICPRGDVQSTEGTVRIGVDCYSFGGPITVRFSDLGGTCGFPPFDDVYIDFTAVTTGTQGSLADVDIVAADGFTISGQYDSTTGEYHGSSAPTTDPNGNTVVEEWGAFASYDLGGALALVEGQSTVTITDPSETAQCQTAARVRFRYDF